MTEQLALPLVSDRRTTGRLFVVSRPELFRDDFAEWLGDNWSVWSAFEIESNKVWDSGRHHYSARTIGEFLRHQTMVCEARGEFKVNNNRFPDMARLYALYYPGRDGFFEFRHSQRAA